MKKDESEWKPFWNNKKRIPLISIVIPVYNSELFLHQCIESVLNQSFSDFELILIDDGSVDSSGKICDEYAKKDYRVVVIHKKNEGPTVARKLGVEIATGLYVMFLDSDDYYKEGLLRCLSEIIEKYSTDVIVFNGIKFDQNGSQSKCQCLLREGLYCGEYIKKIHNSLIVDNKDRIAICYGVCMKVFLRTLYIDFQKTVPKELYKGEDLAVTAPLLASCKSVYVLNMTGYYYRDTPGSLMNSFHTNELMQIKYLADYLEYKMDSFYKSRIDTYVIMHLFDYLDRAIVINGNYQEYRKVIRALQEKGLLWRIKQVKSHSTHFNERLVVNLMKHRLFVLLWWLRKIKKRKDN